MALPLLLLPLLGVTALEMQSQTQSQAELEEAVTDGLRTALADGWTLAEVDADEDELVFTMTKAGHVERHVAHLDGEHNAYRVDRVATGAPAPASPSWQTTNVATALAAGGGIEIGGSCGTLDVRTYTPGPRATNPTAARRLAGALLRAADDLESADLADNRAVFNLTFDGSTAELHVELDATHRIRRAELRHYGYNTDSTTYAKQRALRRAVGKSVTHIEESPDGLVLVGAKRHVIEDASFEPNDPDSDDHTCGC